MLSRKYPYRAKRSIRHRRIHYEHHPLSSASTIKRASSDLEAKLLLRLYEDLRLPEARITASSWLSEFGEAMHL
jgi:hypothetical protein